MSRGSLDEGGLNPPPGSYDTERLSEMNTQLITAGGPAQQSRMIINNAAEIKVEQKTSKNEMILSTKYSLRSNKAIAITYGR